MSVTIFDIIYQLYPDANGVTNKEGVYQAYDKDGKEITINRSNIDAELAKQEYKNKRVYPSIKEQLDLQYWDQVNGTTKWKEAVAKVKSDNPKP